jgi:hypothetical protein
MVASKVPQQKVSIPMALNNILLYNAALNGFMAGAFAGGWPTDPTAADYADIADQAETFAVALDTAIANDASISQAGGAAVVGAGTSALVEGQAAKPGLLQAIVFGVTFSRYQTGAPASVFATSIAAVKAIYTECLTKADFT